MEDYYLENFEQMKQGVGKLKQIVNRFLENTITPVFDNIRDFPADIELEIHSLVQKTTNLATSFSPLEQRIDDIDKAGVNFYSVAGLANKLESAIEEWQSGFTTIKDTWSSIAGVLSQSIYPAEPAKPEDLLKSIIGECGKIQQSLQEILLKVFVYKGLEPSIKKISHQVSELKTRLQELVKDWLPQTEQMQHLIEPLMEETTRLTKNSNLTENAEEKFSSLLKKQRGLYELFARWQLFKKIEPALADSLSQLENLEQSFEEALKEWQPASEEIKILYQSILTKYKELEGLKPEESTLGEKYQSLKSGFDQFEAEWSSALKDVSAVLDRWVNRH